MAIPGNTQLAIGGRGATLEASSIRMRNIPNPPTDSWLINQKMPSRRDSHLCINSFLGLASQDARYGRIRDYLVLRLTIRAPFDAEARRGERLGMKGLFQH